MASIFRVLSESLSEEEETKNAVTIICGTKTIIGNKILLQAVSNVFKKMFQAPMVEKKSGVVTIEDVNCDMMEAVLNFYISGSFPNFEELVHEDVLYIIDKYHFIGIKDAFSAEIIRQAKFEDKIELYGLLFKYYGTSAEKKAVMGDVVVQMMAGKHRSTADYMLDLPASDFLLAVEAAKKVFEDADKLSSGSQKANWENLFLFCSDWLGKDPEARSIAALEALGMIDMRGFSEIFFSANVLSLPLDPRFSVLLRCLHSTIEYYRRKYRTTLFSSVKPFIKH